MTRQVSFSPGNVHALSGAPQRALYKNSGRRFFTKCLPGSDLFPYLIIADNRNPGVNHIVEGLCLGRRQVNTAMASAVLVNGSAEFTSPAGIMESDASVKRHPVIHVTLIFVCAVRLLLPAEYPVRLCIGQAVDALRCRVIL